MIEQVVRAVDIKDNSALVEPIRKESCSKECSSTGCGTRLLIEFFAVLVI